MSIATGCGGPPERSPAALTRYEERDKERLKPTAARMQASVQGSKVRTPRIAAPRSGHDAGAPGGSHPPGHQFDADAVPPGTFGHWLGLQRAPDRGVVRQQAVARQ